MFATQNPLEYEVLIPTRSFDRQVFMKIVIKYPSLAGEKEIIKQHHEGFSVML